MDTRKAKQAVAANGTRLDALIHSMDGDCGMNNSGKLVFTSQQCSKQFLFTALFER